MGVFDRLERGPYAAGDPNDPRMWGTVSDLPYARQTYAGFQVTPETALRVSAVFACTSLIAETIASLPCILYKRLPKGGKEKATEHRWYRTLRYRPNSRKTSSVDFFGGGQMNAGLKGLAYAEILDDGRTGELLPMAPELVVKDTLESGRVRYRYRDPLLGGRERPLLQDQVLEVRDLTMNGVDGLARAALAREAIAVAGAAEGYVGRFFRYDATGRLVLTFPHPLSPEQRADWRQTMAENQEGWQNRSKAMFLHSGVKAEELGKHDDSGFIVDPRRFQVADIARFWRVPLFMIGLEEKSTTWGTGIEQQKQGFVDFTIKPWTDRWSQALMRDLLSDDEQEHYVIEFLFDDLVRGDLLARMQAYAIAIINGILSSNEVRAKENLAPRTGGDQYRENSPGAAPNADGGPTPRPSPAPQDDDEDEDEEARRRVPGPLIADVAVRLAAIEVRNLERRAGKAREDLPKWGTWTREFYGEHRRCVTDMLAPIATAYGIPAWIRDAIADRVERTAITALAEGVPAGWLEQRAGELERLIGETLAVASRADRLAETLGAALTQQGEQLEGALAAVRAAVERPIEVTVAPAAVTTPVTVENHHHLPALGQSRTVEITDDKGKVLRRGKITEQG